MTEPTKKIIVITCTKCWRESTLVEDDIVHCEHCEYAMMPLALRLMRPWPNIEIFCRDATETEVAKFTHLSKAGWHARLAVVHLEAASQL